MPRLCASRSFTAIEPSGSISSIVAKISPPAAASAKRGSTRRPIRAPTEVSRPATWSSSERARTRQPSNRPAASRSAAAG